jgi:hypothetical protein
MSVQSEVASPERTPEAASPGPAPPAPVAFHYTQTDSFVALLQQLGASLLVSTYQANNLLVARATGGGLLRLAAALRLAAVVMTNRKADYPAERREESAFP